LIRKAAPLQPKNQYYILGLEKNDSEFSMISNVHFYCLKKPSLTIFGYKWLLDYQIPTYLKKIKADLIIQADGLLCKYTQTPQWMYAHHEKEVNEKTGYSSLYCKRLRRQKKWQGKKKVSAFHFAQDEDTAQKYWQPDVRLYKSENELSETTNEITRQKYTDGHDYFIYVGAVASHSNIIELLKAFSIFKNWQRSSLKLVLVDTENIEDEALQKSMQLYKYKSDVIILKNMEQSVIKDLSSSAYAGIFPMAGAQYFPAIIHVMQQGVPVVVPERKDLKINLKDAVLFAATNHFNDIAAQMIEMYKNEKMRSELIKKAYEYLNEFDEMNCLRQFNEALMRYNNEVT
jgi:glycosyltransferase involved in cell wall biosynthesis